jgi:hypothetical protein
MKKEKYVAICQTYSSGNELKMHDLGLQEVRLYGEAGREKMK